jgi:hypothetical protein
MESLNMLVIVRCLWYINIYMKFLGLVHLLLSSGYWLPLVTTDILLLLACILSLVVLSIRSVS